MDWYQAQLRALPMATAWHLEACVGEGVLTKWDLLYRGQQELLPALAEAPAWAGVAVGGWWLGGWRQGHGGCDVLAHVLARSCIGDWVWLSVAIMWRVAVMMECRLIGAPGKMNMGLGCLQERQATMGVAWGIHC